MRRIPVYILAGGAHTPGPKGNDPARADYEGQPLVLHQARKWAVRATRVTVVADRKLAYADLQLRCIPDLAPEFGPLGGLHAALLDAATSFIDAAQRPADLARPRLGSQRADEDAVNQDWILLLANNRVGLETAWLDALLDQRTDHTHAVVFRSARAGQAFEPYCGLYHIGMLDRINEQLGRGVLALWRLIESVPHRTLAPPVGWPRVRKILAPRAEVKV